MTERTHIPRRPCFLISLTPFECYIRPSLFIFILVFLFQSAISGPPLLLLLFLKFTFSWALQVLHHDHDDHYHHDHHDDHQHQDHHHVGLECD